MSNCSNCGSKVNPGENFCRVCGTKIQNQQNATVYENQKLNNNIENTMFIEFPLEEGKPYIENNDEYLIDSYIGKNSDKLKNGSFSINTFLFGFFYVLYRKMWLLGFTWLAIGMIGNTFLPSIAKMITFVLNIVMCTQFKKWYLKHVKEQVEKIKQENIGKTRDELAQICRQKGGTSAIPVVISLIVFILLVILTYSPESLTEDSSSEYDYGNYNTNSNNSKVNIENKFGTISNLSVDIPNTMTESTLISDSYKTYTSEDYNCKIILTTSTAKFYNNDVINYLEKGIYYTVSDVYSGIEETTINNRIWYHATLTRSGGKIQYYATLDGDKIYEADFYSYSDEYGSCSQDYNAIINSMRFD